MKLIFILFLLPLFCSAQSANIHHYKLATPTDTTFENATGLLKVDTITNGGSLSASGILTMNADITINGTVYAGMPGQKITSQFTGYTYIPYTLSNGWSAVLTRFCNGELEAVTVDEGAQQEVYYTR